MTFDEVLGLIVDGFEALGVGILVIGSVAGIVGYARDVRELDRTQAYGRLRTNFGRTILLGLEVLIVADIVLDGRDRPDHRERDHPGDHRPGPNVPELLAQIELEGVVPWRRRAVSAAAGTTDPL